MHRLDNGIIKTLCYADIFDFPLTENEIYQRFIADAKTSPQTIKRRLSLLHQQGIVKQIGPYFYLEGRDGIVKKRQARHHNSEQKSTLATTIAKKCAKIPYIRAVFLTGATAVKNATRQDDIDIMIVSAPNSLWTCRFFAIMYLELLGVRRRPHETDATNKVCLNLMLTADALAVPKSMQNLYRAHEVVQAQPLYDPNNYWATFQNVNSWVTQYLPNTVMPTSLPTRNRENQVPPLFEAFFRHMQRLYMWPNKTREIITPSSAYFHPRDTGRIVLAKFAKRLKLYT